MVGGAVQDKNVAVDGALGVSNEAEKVSFMEFHGLRNLSHFGCIRRPRCNLKLVLWGAMRFGPRGGHKSLMVVRWEVT